MKVLVVEPHKKPYEKDVEHTLESLQGIVGGLIEPIYFDDSAIIVNEEGKINGLPFNRALLRHVLYLRIGRGRFHRHSRTGYPEIFKNVFP